jgi:hypothetical protein
MAPLFPQSSKFKYFYSNKNPFIVGEPLLIHDSNVASSSCGPFACFPPLFSPCNIDISNDLNHEDPISDDLPTLEIDLLNV